MSAYISVELTAATGFSIFKVITYSALICGITTMKKTTILSFLLLLTSIIVLQAQGVRVARIIAMKGNVTVDDDAASIGQEIFAHNKKIIISGKGSYATLLSSEGDVKTFDAAILNVRSIVASARTRRYTKPFHSHGTPLGWTCHNLYQPQFMVGDSLLLHWKTKVQPPFIVRVQSIFGDELRTITTDNDSIYMSLVDLFATEQHLLLTVSAGPHHKTEVFLQKTTPEKTIQLNEELAAINASAADKKVIRLALLIKHKFIVDYLYEKSRLTATDIAALSSDTKQFALKSDLYKF
ncbi:hypothetical protein [Pseudochryseolinea flava]|uniref:Uncharacterized protein n=1 Tax=Pseudochryseolinea flava TaxID=2059302 RepID=A0A364Y3K7_9BACT|nr:hypothetical protein [Pseudochryseolinea flava]RAW00736.1 hypothetical protein DQQ10_14250 [Pseudochryseolinea flava]